MPVVLHLQLVTSAIPKNLEHRFRRVEANRNPRASELRGEWLRR